MQKPCKFIIRLSILSHSRNWLKKKTLAYFCDETKLCCRTN